MDQNGFFFSFCNRKKKICSQRMTKLADAQTDLSLRWANRSFYLFCHALAHIVFALLFFALQKYCIFVWVSIYAIFNNPVF